MKIRRLADDFRVEEVSGLPIGPHGSFAVYRLDKVHWTTLDAMDRLARELNLPRRNLAHAGLKDRHARTSQLITIRNGPRRNAGDQQVSLAYLGQSPRPIAADDILANRFTIVVRSLAEKELQAAQSALAEIREGALINYFDDQRFGSWFPDQGFIAEAWIRQEYERALWLTFAEHEPGDDRHERQQKELLRSQWGDWTACKARLERSHRRSIVTYLCDHPADFKGAWARVNPDWRGLFLSALQSDLWNRVASLFLERRLPAADLVSVALKPGLVAFPRRLSPEQREAWKDFHIPLPSARLARSRRQSARAAQRSADQRTAPRGAEESPTTTSAAAELDAIMAEALAARGWKLDELKVRAPQDRFFSRGQRDLLLPVQDLTGQAEEDELDPPRRRLTLRFALPRGAYATMLIKRLFAAADA